MFKLLAGVFRKRIKEQPKTESTNVVMVVTNYSVNPTEEGLIRIELKSVITLNSVAAQVLIDRLEDNNQPTPITDSIISICTLHRNEQKAPMAKALEDTVRKQRGILNDRS